MLDSAANIKYRKSKLHFLFNKTFHGENVLRDLIIISHVRETALLLVKEEDVQTISFKCIIKLFLIERIKKTNWCS